MSQSDNSAKDTSIYPAKSGSGPGPVITSRVQVVKQYQYRKFSVHYLSKGLTITKRLDRVRQDV